MKKYRKYLNNQSKQFSNDLLNMSTAQCDVFLDELQYWDGTVSQHGTVILDSVDFVSNSFIQTLIHLRGGRSIAGEFTKKNTLKPDELYKIPRVSISTKDPFVSTNTLDITKYPSTEKVGCVSVPSSYLLVKQDYNIFVSGNCLSFDTEILTKDGWVNHSTITPSSLVANWDSETKTITYTTPSDIIKGINKDMVVNIVTDRLSQRVTANHRVVL